MDAPSMFTRKQVPEDIGVRNTGEEGGQGQLHREEKEHKPVLKKVKEKVKKIKHTLTGHSHGQQHDEGGISDEEEEGDAALEREAAMEKGGYMEDVEDKPVLASEPDPEVHGAPMYESERLPAVQDLVAKYDPAKAPAVREAHGADAQGARFGGPGFHDPLAQEARLGADASGTRFGGPAVHDPAAHGADARAVHDPLAREARHGADASGVHFGNLGGGAVHDPHDGSVQEAPRDDAPKMRLGDLGGPVVEDPAAPRSKTPAAREGEDIGATPVVREFESMSLSDDPSHIGAAKHGGAHAEEWTSSGAAPTYTEKIKSVAAVPAEYGRKLASTVYEKVAGGTGAAATDSPRGDERTETVPVSDVAGAGEEWKYTTTTADRSSSGPGYTDKIKATAAGTTEYGKQLASAAYEKVAGVAPSLRPQVDERKQQAEEEPRSESMPESDVVSALERTKPSAAGINNNSSASSGPGYTEKIKSAAAGTTEYGKQLATTVYEKVAGAGAAVAGKVQQATQSAGTATPGVGAQQHDTTRTVTPGAGGPGNGQDKGVVGVTGYIAEKLRPGEEDRALSSAIADAVQRRKEEVGGTVGQRVPAPGGVIAKAREAVTSLTGGNRVSETVKPDAAKGAEVRENVAADAPVLRGEEIGEPKLNTNTM
ncbi:hypothetical protein PR202_ga07519 [Eleusine coracana subsp. coracana]|uniref:Uncharacterized protein n=1 Tax=Eleusine coracana subsp. coracana TaxID=191504 RepID=A0AAV5BXW2_ELECO|nr:hypothetical protein PR202_ga07519 [Eleusine coracana subsp. coracana]